ncbi:MAG TPA: sortase, partial [Ktedonobacteraceae bacterium]|nr:sortase [Ktedonobacteraceae bacterium]
LIGKGINASVIVQTLSVQAGTPYTVVARGTKSTGYSLKVFVDNNLMAVGMAKVRFYDLSPRAYSLSIATGGLTIPGALSYTQASNYLKLPAGLYTFTVSASRPSFSLLDQVTLKTNMVTSIFIVGVFHGSPPLLFVHVQIKGLPNMSGTGSDPNALPTNASPFTPLAPWSLGVLALGGMSAGVLTRLWPFRRQKATNRPPRLFWTVLTAMVALALSVAGLSLAPPTASLVPPPFVRLLIPAIGVNAPIESVGVRPDGTMETPAQRPWNDVGWYNSGPRPGERGSAVIAGHLDRPGGNPAVFWRLRDLRVGDSVLVVDASGKALRFHVTRIIFFQPQDAPVQDIFGNTAGSFLNLTTCAGDWIPTQHQTALRLVVYTSLAGQAPAYTPTVTPTTGPQKGLYIVGAYNGSMYDETKQQTTYISVSIKQSKGRADFRGTFTVTSPSQRAYPLRGKVDLQGNFSFTVQQPGGQMPLYFYGTVQHQQGVDYLHGNFCSSSTNSCSVNTGYFTVGPRY